jgi:hypothetical protein
MKAAHSNYSTKYTTFNYRLPQIESEASGVISRIFTNGLVNTAKELGNRMFGV